MLENLWLRQERRNKYVNIFLFSVVFSVISVFISYKFLNFAYGLSSVFMISLAAAYPLIRYLNVEEKEEIDLVVKYSEKRLLKRHGRELGIYLSFFAGVIVVFIVSTFILPSNFFAIQKQTINYLVSGNATSNQLFWEILFNNLKVFGLTALISFLFAAGMIFILVWNGSIFGVFLATYSKGIWHVPGFSLGYLPHGILEYSAYILAGIAGALLSYQIPKLKIEKYRKELFPRVAKDVAILFVIGLICVLLGALVECYL